MNGVKKAGRNDGKDLSNHVLENNNNDCEVVTRLALKHGIVLQGDKNELVNISVDKKENDQLKSLCGIPKAKVKYAVNKVNCVLRITDI